MPVTRRGLVLLLAFLLAAGHAGAASLEGLWLTQDHDGVIEVRTCDTGLCGRIVGMSKTVRPDGGIPVDPQGHPMCGLTILRVAPDGPEHWSGQIVDPKDGSNWNCTLRVDAADNLKLRGYLLVPLLGQTQTWTRYSGRLTNGCAITP